MELDLSGGIYHALDNTIGGVAVARCQKDDDQVILEFDEEIDIVIDDFQALELMQKLAGFFNYQLSEIKQD